MLGGAVASLYGVLTHRLWPEIYGCSFVGGAFLIWGVSALFKPDATLVTLMVTCVLFAGTAGQFYRVGMISESRVDRR